MALISKLFSFKALVPIWLLVFALVAVFNPPMTFANGVLLLMVALVVPVVRHDPSLEGPPLNRCGRVESGGTVILSEMRRCEALKSVAAEA